VITLKLLNKPIFQLSLFK